MHRTDVLVIGSGAAGLRTAIELNERGVDVLVLGKCKRGDAHTVMATGGINAALATMDTKDSWLVHVADTLKEGRFIADAREVELLCRNAPRAIKELADWGVKFHREADGRLTQRFFGAHTYRRTCFVGDETGKDIERALVKEAERRKIQILGEMYITKLLKSGGTVNGAAGFDMRTNEQFVCAAKAVVLATGGHSRLYRRSSSRIMENTGDGVTLAYEAGALLEDMEMVQFHPTGMVWPPVMEGTLVTEAVRGEGGVLTNAKGQHFMTKYDRRGELGPRDVVARAIYNEIISGRATKHHGVWLDVTKLPKEKILERIPKVYRQFAEAGVDVTRERMEVAPTAHYSMGGVHVKNGATRVRGLYAVGEVTSGVHGANRLGGNSLAETVVFGRLVGEAVAKFCKRTKRTEADARAVERAQIELEDLRKQKGKYAPRDLRAELQNVMWDNAGIVRNARDLKEGMERLGELRKKMDEMDISGTAERLVTALDLKNLLVPAEAVLRSALVRCESRGAHYRSDYPEESRRWTANIGCSKGSGGMTVSKRPVPKPSEAILKAVKSVGAAHKLLE
ncbi:MAG: FAD-dependent oxidoreductase [Candidatus Aenigmatarchaeota archaeon]|nr:MAG: FAD-dependent oxidoreductase [Candidatus Aenigmarchaeota archaeon]